MLEGPDKTIEFKSICLSSRTCKTLFLTAPHQHGELVASRKDQPDLPPHNCLELLALLHIAKQSARLLECVQKLNMGTCHSTR